MAIVEKHATAGQRRARVFGEDPWQVDTREVELDRKLALELLALRSDLWRAKKAQGRFLVAVHFGLRGLPGFFDFSRSKMGECQNAMGCWAVALVQPDHFASGLSGSCPLVVLQ